MSIHSWSIVIDNTNLSLIILCAHEKGALPVGFHLSIPTAQTFELPISVQFGSPYNQMDTLDHTSLKNQS